MASKIRNSYYFLFPTLSQHPNGAVSLKITHELLPREKTISHELPCTNSHCPVRHIFWKQIQEKRKKKQKQNQINKKVLIIHLKLEEKQKKKGSNWEELTSLSLSPSPSLSLSRRGVRLQLPQFGRPLGFYKQASPGPDVWAGPKLFRPNLYDLLYY